jgi:hypothetical protein
MTTIHRTYDGEEIVATFSFEATATDPNPNIVDYDDARLIALEIMGRTINIAALSPDVLAAIMDLATEVD